MCGATALICILAAAGLEVGTATARVQEVLAQVPAHWARCGAFGQLGDAETSKLKDVLRERGVPDAQLEERVQAAVKKIGSQEISLALAAKNVWVALKTLASKPSHMFGWIKQDELEQHIQTRARQGFGAVVANAKQKKQKAKGKDTATALQIEPQHLQLSPKSFVAQGAGPICQLALEEVVAQARGVAFCSPQQFLPFLQAYKVLSVEPLALVSTAPLPQEVCAGAPVTHVRYPAIYLPTQEPVLINGSLLQLGDDTVSLAQAEDMEVDQIETEVCKLTLYRDECQFEWQEFTGSPVRHLLQAFPGLSLCRAPSCANDGSCPHFHAAVEEVVESLLLDVWNRSFHKPEGGRCAPEHATCFQAMTRVPASALDHLNRVGGKGLYIEPRGDNGASPHAAFAVVWLPGADLAKALHWLRLCPKALAVTRLGRKYGLRVRECDEQQVFTEVRPGHEYIRVRVSMKYRLHPLPHGFQRQSVSQLLRQCFGDSYVLLTLLKEGPAARAVPAVACASNRTSHIRADEPAASAPASSTADPWAGGRDPWAQYKAGTEKPAQSVAPSPAAASKLSQIENGLRTEMQTVVQQELTAFAAKNSSASSGEVTGRIERLEASVQEMKHQGVKFEEWFRNRRRK